MDRENLAPALVKVLEQRYTELPLEEPEEKSFEERTSDVLDKVRESILSSLERRVFGEKKVILKPKTEDDFAVEAAIETLREVSGIEVPMDFAYKTLEEVKKERIEASQQIEVKRSYNFLHSIRRMAFPVIALCAISGATYRSMQADKRAEERFKESEREIIGEVVEERLNPGAYVLKVKKENGKELLINVVDAEISREGMGRPLRKDALALLIDKGSRVGIAQGNLQHGNWFDMSARNTYPEEDYIYDNTEQANKRADRIKVYNSK